ncbi:MAG TPA: PF20097 family protein [Pyrinomonadaceae bacterium]|jgi:formate dehydrogenase maturation protein FdhE
MAAGEKKCPDCGGEMVEGFILDMTYGGQLVPRWLKGRPEKSMWTGIKAKGKDCRSVETYRCVKCGLLRSYANTEVDPPSLWNF